MDLLDTTCDCGNPDCRTTAHLRKGYIQIRHEDGSEEVRWDWFHIDTWRNESDESTTFIELMLPPEAAHELMWNLILGYMPVVRQFYTIYRRLKYWFEGKIIWPIQKWIKK